MSIAVVSPGLLPVPPIIGGSVETVIDKMAQVTSREFAIHVYGPAHRALAPEEIIGSLHYHRCLKGNDYFKTVRTRIIEKNCPIIQVENRPLFIPRTKAMMPRSKYICSLHSMIHFDEKLIRHNYTCKIFEMCDLILVYSDFMRRKLGEMFPRVSGRIRYIHLGTEPARFKPRWEPAVISRVSALKKKLRIPEKHKVVLFTGRVIPKKGADVLIRAMEQVVRQYPECCLVVVGSSWFGNTVPSAYINSLHQLAGPIAGNIRFTNYVKQDLLPVCFAMADVFVCPSQWDEPFGLVNVEAMASGIPVVASARGGIPEIITDGIDGFLVGDEKNPGAFRDAVLRLLEDRDLAESMGKAGRKRCEEYFNWERAGRELCDLYRELLPDLK
ncbi:MAG: hypothetical protein CVU89_07930 [Firmicutes bacterium HGW-Firmicutes-14]|nr:MAG: hypothetical protein CVU89_07930 [Firmicutes bacterium HGW-Firmicutes-14]